MPPERFHPGVGLSSPCRAPHAIRLVNFLRYPGREVVFVSGEFGLKSHEMSDVDKPVQIGHLTRRADWR